MRLSTALIALNLATWGTNVAQQTPSAGYPPPGHLIDIGGRKLHLHCTGRDTPTVILVAGGGAFSIDWTLVQPRLGFAYRLTEKLAARGGYGMFIPNPNNNWLQGYGFSNNTSLVNSPDGGRTPYPNLLSNPFPNGINVPPGASLGALTYVGKSFNWSQPDFHLARSHHFGAETPKVALDLLLQYVGGRTSFRRTAERKRAEAALYERLRRGERRGLFAWRTEGNSTAGVRYGTGREVQIGLRFIF